MYYLNHEQLEARLNIIPTIIESAKSSIVQLANEDSDKTSQTIGPMSTNQTLVVLALERVILMSIECVTDIGSLLIDGFLMRDASSYEDIVEILKDEKAIKPELAEQLIELILWRKPLMQQYFETYNHDSLLETGSQLPEMLSQFSSEIHFFVQKEIEGTVR